MARIRAIISQLTNHSSYASSTTHWLSRSWEGLCTVHRLKFDIEPPDLWVLGFPVWLYSPIYIHSEILVTHYFLSWHSVSVTLYITSEILVPNSECWGFPVKATRTLLSLHSQQELLQYDIYGNSNKWQKKRSSSNFTRGLWIEHMEETGQDKDNQALLEKSK